MNNSDLREYMNLFEKKLEEVTLMKLPYGTGDLAPVLSKDNVEYHYNVLSKGYVDRYNNKEGDPNFNYGGAMLHNLWWTQLQKPGGANAPTGPIKEFINDNFDNYNSFKDEVLLTAMKLQGSGWVYLSKNGQVKTTPNHTYKSDILMPIDMWEHSFSDYTKEGKECKKKYIQNMMRIINWDVINQRLA